MLFPPLSSPPLSFLSLPLIWSYPAYGADLPRWPGYSLCRRFSLCRRWRAHPLFSDSAGMRSILLSRLVRWCTIERSSLGRPDTVLGERPRCKGSATAHGRGCLTLDGLFQTLPSLPLRPFPLRSASKAGLSPPVEASLWPSKRAVLAREGAGTG